MTFQVALADCIDWLKAIETESVDLICCDSAYASLEKHRATGTTTRLTADWFEVIPNERWPELMRECYRVLKRDAHAYFMADEETTHDVTKPAARAAGFTFWKSLTWVKTKGYPIPDELVHEDVRIGMGYHWRNAEERVAFLEKGKRRLNHLGWSCVLPYPRVAEADVGRKPYPTEKPVELLKRLIENSSDPGDLVIDPFMGSGSTGEASLRLGRRFAGCDIDQRAVDLTRRRLAPLGTEATVLRPRTTAAQQCLFGG